MDTPALRLLTSRRAERESGVSRYHLIQMMVSGEINSAPVDDVPCVIVDGKYRRAIRKAWTRKAA